MCVCVLFYANRRQLMGQLESLMKMLKNQQTSSSPRSTPNSSPRSGKSPPIPQQQQQPNQHTKPLDIQSNSAAKHQNQLSPPQGTV